ncbi:MAG: SAVED domain-containing protein, partial [Clostridia bacterium]|nr:SAVED domain-containing protein [Clostridia bacterium]
KKNSLKSYKRHFRKQKINLVQIIKNMRDASKITYCGFSSQMFSVFDGYILGDTNNYDFIEIKKNNSYYLISEKRKNIQDTIILDDYNQEINLVVETSYQIDESKCLNNPTIKLDMQEPTRITNDYLNKVYSSVKNILDACGSKNIKTVNLYMTAKQSVAFIVGTAIQSYHPKVRVFNYDNNNFKYYLEVQRGVIREMVSNG